MFFFICKFIFDNIYIFEIQLYMIMSDSGINTNSLYANETHLTCIIYNKYVA